MRNHLFIIVLLASSCSFTQKIKDGEMAFDRKQYAVAINMLSEEFDRVDYPELKARKAYLIAESYKEINNVPESIEWYKSAFDLKYGDRALERLGYALKKNEQYKEAVNIFRAVEKRTGQSPKIAREINECIQASQWIATIDQSPFETRKIPQNSPYSDYAPAFYEGNQLVFTSDRKNIRNEEIYKWTGNWFSDLYKVTQGGADPLPFDPSINSEHNDGAACFNSDFTELFFTRCNSKLDDDFCRIMTSTKTGFGWSTPQELPFTEDRINYAHPSLHQGDSILFFTAEIEAGFGGYDIYYVERREKGWGNPQVLGRGVNTIGNEKFPFIYEDTLYFASDGWAGMGGLDIFRTHVQTDGSWSDVENMKVPINSGADDFSLIIDINKRKITGELTGFLSSSRKGSAGDDIYAFKSKIIEIPVEEEIITEKEPEKIKLYLAIKTNEDRFLVDDDPQSGKVGRQDLQDVNLEITGTGGSQKLSSGTKGFVVIDIEVGGSYQIRADKDQYLSAALDFTPTKIPTKGEKTYNVNLLLEKIYVDREVILSNIFYDYEQSFIRDDAKPSLNELSSLLMNNPKIKIQLLSHTDCRGEDDFNQNLSQARAKAAVDYLVSTGISLDRMVANGLGETRPAINCYCETCSEDEHQENRRTSFKIIEF